MKIVIGVPIPIVLYPDFVYNLIEIISTTKSQLPNVEVYYKHQGGVRTDKNRNVILKEALENDVDYILWLDADMVFPKDIIIKYLQHEFDVVGCFYHKRKPPYDPVVYIEGTNPLKPYRAIDPTVQPKDSLVEVDGIGFGGVMVNTRVYKAMGDDKWMNYGVNFHLPFETEGGLTHDLEWCKKARSYGFKIYAHTGVKASHITEKLVTENDWLNELDKKEQEVMKVNVIMPTIHPEEAQRAAKILSSRAGYPHKMIVIEDAERSGFVTTCNFAVKENPADYYVYLTDDIYPSRNWLKDSLELAIEKKAGLVGYNDSKWKGSIATCGLVEHNWMIKNYDGNMFFPGYFGHYNDTELTVLALSDKKYAYDANISLIEVDYEKDTKKVHENDRELFKTRKGTGFDGRITDQTLIENYA